MATQKKQQDRELTVIARVACKTNKALNGHVCTLIRNDKGEKHQVWTHSNGCSSSCSCDGYQKFHKVCYHIRFVEARERLRKQGQSTANTAVVASVTAPAQVTKKATAPAEQKKQTAAAAPVATTEPTAITDEEVEAVLAEIDAQAVAPVATTEPVKVVETPAPRKREMSSVEREMPAFLMAGGSRGGYLPGRATTAAKKKAS
jgi:hypothetical protein